MATGAAALVAASAGADFSHVEARDVSEEVGTPPGLRTWRLVAIFDEPLEGVRDVWGSPVRPIVFDTNAPNGIVNDGDSIVAGYESEDFPYFHGTGTAAWDSFFAMTLSTCPVCDPGFAGPDVSCDWGYSIGFLGSDGVHSVLVDGMTAFVVDEDQGWYRIINATCAEVVLAQFTIEEGYGVRLSGLLRRFEGTFVDVASFCVSSGDFTRCDGDVDEDGDVATGDLRVVLSAWGPCRAECPADLDGNGAVEFRDLLVVLGAWGPCPFTSGACCLPDGSCFESACTDGLECENHGGAWMGAGTACAPNPCPE